MAQVVETTLDDVVAGVVGAERRQGVALGVDLVLVAVVVLAAEDRAATSGSDLDFRLVDRVAVDLVALLVAELDLSREVVGPVTEQLKRLVLGYVVVVVPM